MRDEVPLRWIERAEARRVLAAALSERAPDPSPDAATHETLTLRLRRVLSRLAPNLATWRLHAQPVVARRPTAHPAPRRGDAKGYSGDW